jgi:hypothetical protein
MLCLCEKLPLFNKFKPEISNLKLRAESISKQLHGWIESSKNSEIKGVKFLTEKERRKIQQIKEDKEFQELLQKVTRGEKIDWDKI